jgi:hypothetical protein
VREEPIIRDMKEKDLKETMNEGRITASKTIEATITGHTTTAHLLTETAPVAPVHTTTATEETGDITIMEEVEAMDNTAKAAEGMAITDLPMAVTALHMEIKETMTALTTNALTTGHASRDMTVGRPKPILPLLQEMSCPMETARKRGGPAWEIYVQTHIHLHPTRITTIAETPDRCTEITTVEEEVIITTAIRHHKDAVRPITTPMRNTASRNN